MRPAGEITQALLQAARDLATSERGATMTELAHHARVSVEVAKDRVKKLASRGHLQQVGERRVEYRNRPVVEYAPAAEVCDNDDQVMTGSTALGNCLQAWIR